MLIGVIDRRGRVPQRGWQGKSGAGHQILVRRNRSFAGAGPAWATIVGPAWSAAAAAQAQAAADSNGAFADASQAWADAVGSAFVGWAMAQAQADADFGIAGAIAGATAGKAAAAAGSIYTAAVSKAAGDLTRALNAVQTGFVDAATAASLKATKAIAAAETVERKAVTKADVVLAQDLQSAWGTYAAAECGAVILNARERTTIGADYKKDVAGAELAAVKAVAPARKTSMIAAAEANGVYHVKLTGIIADLGILSGEIRVESTKAKATSLSDWLGKKAQALWTTANDVVGTISKSYDAISMAAHTTLSGLGVIPGWGVVPDAADFVLTLAELPFGKSDGKDLGLAAVGVFATVAPGTVDVAAAGAKIGTRMAKAGAKVADGVGAAGKGFGDAVGAGKKLLSTEPNRIYSARELIRRSTDPGPFHNFPESLNTTIFNQGARTYVPEFFRHSKKGLSNDAIQYRLPGTVNGKSGVFEIFTRPSVTGRTEVIIHRFFNPTKP